MQTTTDGRGPKLLRSACVVVLLMGVPARADDTAGKIGATDERSFLQSASNGGLAEVELGKLAEQRGSNQAVKSFGARMVKDHERANKELETLAARKGVSFPTRIDRKDEQFRERLSKLSGNAFDRAYMDAMTSDHEHDVADFRQASEAASDPDVREFAGRTLPTLMEHLDEAQRIQTAVAGGPEQMTGAQPPRSGYR